MSTPKQPGRPVSGHQPYIKRRNYPQMRIREATVQAALEDKDVEEAGTSSAKELKDCLEKRGG